MQMIFVCITTSLQLYLLACQKYLSVLKAFSSVLCALSLHAVYPLPPSYNPLLLVSLYNILRNISAVMHLLWDVFFLFPLISRHKKFICSSLLSTQSLLLLGLGFQMQILTPVLFFFFESFYFLFDEIIVFNFPSN